MSVLVEACVDSVASALAAERGGAGRVELCDALYDGGTTPSAGMIAAVKATVQIPVFVIVRPRGGGFVYSDAELGVMRLDVEAARMLGADGIVVGALTDDGRIDVERMRVLVRAAEGLPVTFHRAFDLVHDRAEGLETLVALGIRRVLTSGGAPHAIDGVEPLRRLVRHAAGRVEIVAGGGVREEHVQELVHRSGVREVHVRGTRLTSVSTSNGHDAVQLRKSLPADPAAWEETDEVRIREFVRLANA